MAVKSEGRKKAEARSYCRNHCSGCWVGALRRNVSLATSRASRHSRLVAMITSNMNKNEAILSQTVEQLERISEALDPCLGSYQRQLQAPPEVLDIFQADRKANEVP